jgi:mono/diheme cytochrome c family protein
MKSIESKRALFTLLPLGAIALPLVAGSVAACSHAHPDAGEPSAIDVGAVPATPGPQPTFGPLISQKEPPPPISGGTLAIAADGTTAVAADADRDRIYVVDLPARAVKFSINLPHRSEPGRVAVDATNHAHVVLRSSGGLATIDLATGALSIMDNVCIAPRGVAYDAKQKAVFVACASGELVTIRDDKSPRTSRILDGDLRDVVVLGDGTLQVTQFRSAGSFMVQNDLSAPFIPTTDGSNLMWRAISMNPHPTPDCVASDCPASSESAVVTQQPTPEPVRPEPGGYGGSSSVGSPLDIPGCDRQSGGIITTKVSVGGGSINLPEAVLPVDMATNGRELAVVAAGNAFTQALPQIFVVFADIVRESSASTGGGCVPTVHGNVPGQAIAAAFDGNDALVVQTREPAALHIMTEDRRVPWKSITLATDSVADTGHQIFHSNAGGFIACASCHAEGRDDGHVWTFVGQGPRRTPSLLGTVAGTEPFHWDGDQKNMRELVDHVFVERMSGPKVDDGQLGALSGWLYALPPPAKLRVEGPDTDAGKTLFEQRCTACHSGEKLTNNKNVDVGTGGSFQVPSLVGVAWRRPLLHTGCAQHLRDRFDPACGGSAHADTSDLSPAQIDDLVRFLETL